MKKSLLTFTLMLLICPSILKGQIAMRQAGLRMGYSSGIFYQAGTKQGSAEIAYNAMLGFRKNGIQLTGLKIVYETPFDRVSHDLHFSWGYGGHVGYIYSDHVKFMGEDYYFPDERFCPLFLSAKKSSAPKITRVNTVISGERSMFSIVSSSASPMNMAGRVPITRNQASFRS